jgi:hypothetical protein
LLKLADVRGDLHFSKEEWSGVQKVLAADQAKDYANYRECVQQLVPLFLGKLRAPNRSTRRHLSEKQIASLASAIRVTGWQKADIIWTGDEGEPELYAKDFGKAFKRGDVPDVVVHTLGMFLPSQWGLIVLQTKNDSWADLKRILKDAANIRATVMSPGDGPIPGWRDYPVLIVGHREDM